MVRFIVLSFLITVIILFPTFSQDTMPLQIWASVHDPAIVKAGEYYYVFGSHLAVAKSKDLMLWQVVNSDQRDGNRIIPKISKELSEAFEYAEIPSPDIWAPCVIQLLDKKFYMYYCVSSFGAFRSLIGIAVSDSIEGPYKNLQIIIRSGIRFEEGLAPDGTIYDPMKHPNCIDPHVFYDKDGRLWMSYGSYFGGIYIIQLDPKTGLSLPNQGYGKRLAGGNHAPIEGSFIIYNPQTKYYYLFLSFGGLDSKGGYNIRVARSENPDGPYFDWEGKDMREAIGRDRERVGAYGVKLIGNFNLNRENPRSTLTYGYVSPGHNSVYYDKDTDKWYIVFHTRFPGKGEYFTIRVHQLFFNSDGWPVIAPFPYGGETLRSLNIDEIRGEYFLINHGKDISSDIKTPINIILKEDGTIIGEIKGRWEVRDNFINLILEEEKYKEEYKGVILSQWNPNTMKKTITFSCLSKKGISIWGIKK
ncbi:MAG: glycoside hydrolase family 43 protein [Dictyoglomus sp.]|nr:glycoside hydrolase family 43 protein [Dictyoglomus sp.]MCX7942582.1 glycoside hydrolase family 43 protein [Dictyoglomaceae bacterium]MDW8188992.1 glycoside hydrolase family 43 protein [Dictyoglomus sp.]